VEQTKDHRAFYLVRAFIFSRPDDPVAMPHDAPSDDSSRPEDASPAQADSDSHAEGDERETTEPRTFTVVRQADESGVSGTGRVLDGCIFHNGQVVICWRGDINSEASGYSSLAIYPCWEAFHNVHIGAHPENETEVIFGHGADLTARLIDHGAERNPEDPEPASA
jgi:hypothetical protein